jgi:formylglycine-generating enzyme required for sulfatase activity
MFNQERNRRRAIVPLLTVLIATGVGGAAALTLRHCTGTRHPKPRSKTSYTRKPFRLPQLTSASLGPANRVHLKHGANNGVLVVAQGQDEQFVLTAFGEQQLLTPDSTYTVDDALVLAGLAIKPDPKSPPVFKLTSSKGLEHVAGKFSVLDTEGRVRQTHDAGPSPGLSGSGSAPSATSGSDNPQPGRMQRDAGSSKGDLLANYVENLERALRNLRKRALTFVDLPVKYSFVGGVGVTDGGQQAASDRTRLAIETTYGTDKPNSFRQIVMGTYFAKQPGGSAGPSDRRYSDLSRRIVRTYRVGPDGGGSLPGQNGKVAYPDASVRQEIQLAISVSQEAGPDSQLLGDPHDPSLPTGGHPRTMGFEKITVGESNDPTSEARFVGIVPSSDQKLVSAWLIGQGSLWLPEFPPMAHPGPVRSDRMVHVSGGTFKMGADDGDEDQRPAHNVVVAPFDIDATEVTFADYEACVTAGACPPRNTDRRCNTGKADKTHHPAECVTWFGARAYCTWANKRLPTESEWEYAARGSDGRLYPWGNEPPSTQLCWKSKGTCPVASHPTGATALGVFDMAGNVSEWTDSIYCPYGDGHACSGIMRVCRGASWQSSRTDHVSSLYRGVGMASQPTIGVGVRCTR